jgi:hypothetical protein
LCLLPIASSGLADPRREMAIRRVFRYRDMWTTLKEARDIAKQPSPPYSRSCWSCGRPPELKPPADRCGLVTVATHMASPLSLVDAQRRFCESAPLYGLAYAEPHTTYRSAYCVPLMKEFLSESIVCSRDPESRSRAVGAIALESTRPLAIRPRYASYLACLFHQAVRHLPDELFNGQVRIPPWGIT